jgi:hypothetical protein
MSGMAVSIPGGSASVHVRWINRILTRSCTLFLSATAALFIAMSAYSDDLRATRLGVYMAGLLALHLAWHRRLFWCREFSLYVFFYGYMAFALIWTHDRELAMNTMVPATNFVVIGVFFSSLVRFHEVRTLLFGGIVGFACGAAYYTLTQGFPFSFPEDFSYNAIAGMYLFGLFLTLMLTCFSRLLLPWLAVAVVIMLHIVATTSIKTNLGIALGLVAAAFMYTRHFGRLMRRQALILVCLLVGLIFAVSTNESLLDTMQRGAQRVMLGVEVLQAREDLPGYSAFAERGNWSQFGIEGWKQNPVFGYGTEAFRAAYGITSHSTPIDIMYNFGVIGLLLFYGVFASLAWRLLQLEGPRVSNRRALILGGLVCYAFISLSGTIHYNAFLAVFVGISVALLVPSPRTDKTPPIAEPAG